MNASEQALPPLHSRNISWYWFSFRLPTQWEIRGFTTGEERGELKFHSRDGYEGAIVWRRMTFVPDELRIMDEIQRRALNDLPGNEAESFTSLKTETVGRFLFAYALPGQPCQASLFMKDERILLQWMFPEYSEAKHKRQFNPLLKSFSPNTCDPRRWSAFGMEMQLPARFSLSEVKAMPANQTLTFENEAKLRVTVRRWGLPEYLLNRRSYVDFYRDILQATSARIVASDRRRIHGMDGAVIDFEQQGFYLMEKLSGRWWTGQGILWHNVREKRMYSFEQSGPRKVTERLELDDVFWFET